MRFFIFTALYDLIDLLEIKNLSVKYSNSKQWALSDISFTVKAGQFILVTGASGSGKSTLAQTLMTLIPNFYPAEISGEISINHQILSEIPRSDLIRLFGYVPQYPSDFTTTLSVEEEVALVLENLGEQREIITQRLDEIFSILDINHLRKRIQTELSSGELQRVALAAAFAPKAPILVLDEPMARIDLKSELLLVKILKQLVDLGHTIIAFEHRLDYLLSIADTVILLDNGFLRAQGNPKDIVQMLSTVDVPEVSLLRIDDNNDYPLSITEAEKLVKCHYSNMG